jgi:hypothetical protein
MLHKRGHGFYGLDTDFKNDYLPVDLKSKFKQKV